MRHARIWASMSVFVLLSTTACFHQVVRTGLAAGTTVISKPWVSTWMWGLVAAQPIDVRSECRGNGVAIIETQQSFANGLVGGLTLGIWSPQSVKVTCAAGRASLPGTTRVFAIESDASVADSDAVLQRAIAWSIEHHVSVAVTF